MMEKKMEATISKRLLLVKVLGPGFTQGLGFRYVG